MNERFLRETENEPVGDDFEAMGQVYRDLAGSQFGLRLGLNSARFGGQLMLLALPTRTSANSGTCTNGRAK